MSPNPYVLIVNGKTYGSYATEDESVQLADRIYKRDNGRSTVKVLFHDKLLFELP